MFVSINTPMVFLVLLSCCSWTASAESGVVSSQAYNPVAPLNRVTFPSTVLADVVKAEHWVVFYCVDWYSPCDRMRQTFYDLAIDYDRKLNSQSLFSLKVRFGEVDCATDKVLCNEQQVETYPTLTHHRRGSRVGAWESAGGNFEREANKLFAWIEKAVADSESGGKDKEAADADGGAPLMPEQPLQTAVRVAPLAAAIVGTAVWLCTTGADLWRTVQQLQTQHAAASQGPKDDLKAEPGSASSREEENADRGVARFLPAAWASERTSIEL